MSYEIGLAQLCCYLAVGSGPLWCAGAESIVSHLTKIMSREEVLSGGRDQIERWLKERENQRHGNMEETDSCNGERGGGGGRRGTAWKKVKGIVKGTLTLTQGQGQGCGDYLRECVGGAVWRGAKGKIGTTAKV